MKRLLCTSVLVCLAAAACNCSSTAPVAGDPCEACGGDQVCDDGACRYKDCAEIACKGHQVCIAATTTAPARCEASCVEGWVWDAAALTCVAPGCELLGCASQHRECLGDEGARSCGGGVDGHAEDASGACVPWATCDATPAQASIGAACAAQFRQCLENFPGQAACVDCVDGYVEVDGTCEEKKTCAEIGCAASDRLCEELPNAHCTGCVAGYIEDPTSKECRAPLKCRDRPPCPTGQICFEATASTDALCLAASDCGTDAAPTVGGACAPCPRDCAQREGGIGPYLTAATLYDTCVCETEPGYFVDPGSYGGIRACDADGDGWVKVQAWAVLVGDDPVLKANARCDVRTIDRIVLHNTKDQQRTVSLNPALWLYESQRNDEQGLLDDAYHATPPLLPAYPGRRLKAEELNSLTKVCVSPSENGQVVDFNDNGKDDVDEWQKDPSMADPANPIKGLAEWAYFLELYRGWYEPPAEGEAAGRYHIAEKSRLSGAADGMRLELNYGALPPGKDYWRQCDLKADADLSADKNAGMDFEQYAAEPQWAGMNIASQFKCLKLIATSAQKMLPNQVTKAQAESGTYKINVCSASGASYGPATLPAGAAAANPSDPALTCTVTTTVVDPQASTTKGSPAYLAAINYLDYLPDNGTSYARGCVNECAEYPDRCPGFNPVKIFNSSQCIGDPTNFGFLHCGCSLSSLGDSCEYGCPSKDLMLAFSEVSPRTGIWLCGRTSLTEAVEQQQPQGSGTSYKLQGGIPALPTTATASCGAAGANVYCVTPQ
mgnify:FL=1